MDQEIRYIEKMLKEGKILPEEADKLRSALPRPVRRDIRHAARLVRLSDIFIGCVLVLVALELIFTLSGRGVPALGPSETDPGPRFAADTLAGRDPAALAGLLLRYAVELNDQYRRMPDKNGRNPGRLVLRLAIEPTGRVAWCKVEESTFNDTLIENAVVRRAALWSFGACDSCGTAVFTDLLHISR